jgi:hypothetical protein
MVIIRGHALQGTTSVLFGSTAAASYTVNAAGTAITAYSPAESQGLVDIRVASATGTSGITTADHYTFLAPTVTLVSPNSGRGGTTVILTGRYFQGATRVYFGGSPAASFSVTPASTSTPIGTQIVAIAPNASSGLTYVTVVAPGGVSAATIATRFTYP